MHSIEVYKGMYNIEGQEASMQANTTRVGMAASPVVTFGQCRLNHVLARSYFLAPVPKAELGVLRQFSLVHKLN